MVNKEYLEAMLSSDFSAFKEKMSSLSTPRGIMATYKLIVQYYDNAARKLFLREDQKQALYQTFKKREERNIEKKCEELQTFLEDKYCKELEETKEQLKLKEKKVKDIKKAMRRLKNEKKENEGNEQQVKYLELMIEKLKVQNEMLINDIERGKDKIVKLEDKLDDEKDYSEKKKIEIMEMKMKSKQKKKEFNEMKDKLKKEKKEYDRELKNWKTEMEYKVKEAKMESKLEVQQLKRNAEDLEKELEQTKGELTLVRTKSGSEELTRLKSLLQEKQSMVMSLQQELSKTQNMPYSFLQDENKLLKTKVDELKMQLLSPNSNTQTIMEESTKGKNVVFIQSNMGSSNLPLSQTAIPQSSLKDVENLKKENGMLQALLVSKKADITEMQETIAMLKSKDSSSEKMGDWKVLNSTNKDVKEKLANHINFLVSSVQGLLNEKVEMMEKKVEKIHDLVDEVDSKHMTVEAMRIELAKSRLSLGGSEGRKDYYKSKKNYRGRGRKYKGRGDRYRGKKRRDNSSDDGNDYQIDDERVRRKKKGLLSNISSKFSLIGKKKYQR